MITASPEAGDIVDSDHGKRWGSALLWLGFRLFLRLPQWHGLLKCLTHFVQPFFIEVMHPSGTLCAQVNQLFVLAHKVDLSLLVYFNGLTETAMISDKALIMEPERPHNQKKPFQTSISTHNP